MPNDIIRQPNHPKPGPLRHGREPLRIGLVLERVAGEIDAGAVDVRLDEDVDAADAVEGDFGVEVLLPLVGGGVGHPVEGGAVGAVFFVAWGEGVGEWWLVRWLSGRVGWCWFFCVRSRGGARGRDKEGMEAKEVGRLELGD